jgi:hypothetical protein
MKVTKAKEWYGTEHSSLVPKFLGSNPGKDLPGLKFAHKI